MILSDERDANNLIDSFIEAIKEGATYSIALEPRDIARLVDALLNRLIIAEDTKRKINES